MGDAALPQALPAQAAEALVKPAPAVWRSARLVASMAAEAGSAPDLDQGEQRGRSRTKGLPARMQVRRSAAQPTRAPEDARPPPPLRLRSRPVQAKLKTEARAGACDAGGLRRCAPFESLSVFLTHAPQLCAFWISTVSAFRELGDICLC